MKIVSEEDRLKEFKKAENIQFVQKMMLWDENKRDAFRTNIDIDEIYNE